MSTDARRVVAEHAGDCPYQLRAVVVGAEHVERTVEAAIELVGEIDDVRGAIGRRASLGADEDAIVVVPVGGRTSPEGAVLLVGVQARQVVGQPLLGTSLCRAQESKWIRSARAVASMRSSISGTGSCGSSASSAM